MAAKKETSSNFSNKEIEILISIIHQYKHVIECKKTDATTWREENVTKAFNCNSGEVFKSKKTLKAKYQDMKKCIKKKLAHNRMEQFKTGGGTPDIRPLTGIVETIVSMLPSTTEGLPSILDSDQSMVETSKENADTDTEMQFLETNNNIYDDRHIEINSPTRTFDSPTRTLDYDEMNTEFIVNDENKENEETKTSDNEENRGCKKTRNVKNTGVSILRKKIASELRTNKKLKKMQPIPHETSERDMKEEIHETRIKILKKELEIKEHQFFAELEINAERLKLLKVEKDIKVLQKQIKEAKLANLRLN